jgi:hypothetical protein
MANNITRMPRQQMAMPRQQAIADPASGWTWDGSQWVCGDCDDGSFPCPSPFPPAFSGPAQQPPWYPGANGGVSFGTNAPQNPVRGHFWWDGATLWIFDGAAWVDSSTGVTFPGGGGSSSSSSGAGTVIISTSPPGNPQTGAQWWDGAVLRVWDGTQWMIVGPGAHAGPVPTTTHTFRLVQPTTVTIPVNVWSPVPFNATPQIDPQLSWNPTTYRITPTKAGMYLWFIRSYIATASGAVGVGLARNDPGSIGSGVGIEWTALSTEGTASSVAAWLGGGGISIMNGTTDYVRVFAYSGDGNVYGSAVALIDAYLLP